MSRLLSELLAAEEPMFTMAIQQLEQVSGNTSVDVRLTAEIVGKVHMKIRALGLDPSDTTGPELYRALVNLLKQHDEFLARRIGIEDPHDADEVLRRIAEAVPALNIPRKAWVMKPAVAKRLIKQTPPKRVMKQLGYRSIDSMIKREPVHELYAAMRFLETKEWLDKFIDKYNALKPSDFENRQIELVRMGVDKWGESAMDFVHTNRQNITHLKELGIIALLPLPIKRMSGLTIVTLPLILHYINEIRVYATFFKSQQTRSDFAKIIIETLVADPGKHVSVAGHHIHWRVIHRHLGSKDATIADLFEPHVEPDDLIWRKAEETLFRLEPALHFWFDMEYVGVEFDGRPISFNLMDVAISYVNNLPYGSQAVHHMRQNIWNEIYLRYVREQAIERQVARQFGQSDSELDIIALGLDGNI
jgi:hypothetical protein